MIEKDFGFVGRLLALALVVPLAACGAVIDRTAEKLADAAEGYCLASDPDARAFTVKEVNEELESRDSPIRVMGAVFDCDGDGKADF